MKNLFLKIKWILNKSKFILPYLIALTIINSIFSALSVYQALVSKNVIDFALSSDIDNLIKYIIIAISISLIGIFASPPISLFSTYISNKFTNKIQENIYSHVLLSKWSEQTNYHSMDIVTRISNDTASLNSLIIGTIPSIISLLVTLVSSFYILFSINRNYALISIVFFPIFFLISRFYGKKQKAIYKEVQETETKYNSFIQESISNSMIIKTFCREKYNLADLNNLQDKRIKLSLKRTKINSITNLVINLGMSGGYLIVYVLGALSIGFGTITMGSYTALIQLFQKVQSPIYSLAASFPQIISALGATERLMELENLSPEEKLDSKITTENFKEINFKDVSFSYNEDKSILEGVNLKIESGETIGIVGESGKGKTTLLKLLLSLIEPKKGTIYVNNEQLNPNHRELLSYVPQGNTLISGTIEDNLKYGKNEFSEEEMLEALDLSCASKFIKELPKGLNTEINEKGVGLSEGQAQRIAIARAILRKKPILLLDEATSALDMDTEIKLLENLKKLSYKPTTIIITHRPSALDICTKVLSVSKNIIEI